MSGINFTRVRGSQILHNTTIYTPFQYVEKTTAGELRSRVLRDDCPDILISDLGRWS